MSGPQKNDLPYGSVALALYAAPRLPYPDWKPLTADQITDHTRQGMERVGGLQVLNEMHMEMLRLNRALLHNTLGDDAYRQAMLDLLATVQEPDPERLNRCLSYAWRRLRAS